MEAFQQRVIDEKTELDSKLEKLTTFIQGDLYTNLEKDERLRLIRQTSYMRSYSDILTERIAAFKQ